MSIDLQPFLEDLEQRLEPQAEEALLAAWRQFNAGEFAGDIFSPRRPQASPSVLEWPSVTVNAALQDYDQMALQQLAACSNVLASGNGALLNVRSNYGSSILPSLFGVELFIMEAGHNTLPTSQPLPGGLDGIRRLLAAGIPDLEGGLGARVFAMGQYFQELFAPYPKLRQYVAIYHPDLQGPMDACEVLCGSAMFLYLIDYPELMHACLALITSTYAAFMQRWLKIVPAEGPDSRHWGFLHRGRIMLRDDSAMNLSPEMFQEFIAPYNQRLLDIFGGGGDHFCGRGDHFIACLQKLRGLCGIAMSQPEYNQMEKIFTHTVDCGLNLYGLRRDAAQEALQRGRLLHGRVHCW
ncbi:MAG: hypothetical protein GX564_08260 [Oligosphaeraceae bacterium]|nr:hypothetical protein [Oligosphaeraceae bacterium]